jgi:hypothetical protein
LHDMRERQVSTALLVTFYSVVITAAPLVVYCSWMKQLGRVGAWYSQGQNVQSSGTRIVAMQCP